MFSHAVSRLKAPSKLQTALACALFASAACGNSDDGSGASGGAGGTGGSSRAGRGGSAGAQVPAGNGGSGATAGSGGRAGSAGKAGANGGDTGNTAGTGNTTGDAGSGGDAGTGGSGGFSDECISPCLKELFAACRPKDSCAVETMNNGRTFVECEASSGYRREGNLDPAMGDPTLTVTMDGDPCYTATNADGTWSFYAPDQTLVATTTVMSGGGMGRCPELEEPGSEPVYYPVDLQDPRCASVTCTEGSCP